MNPIVQNFVVLQPMPVGLVDAEGFDVKSNSEAEKIFKTHGSTRHLQRRT